MTVNQHATIKVYNGYGDTQDMVVYGHVFNNKLVARRNYSKNIFLNIVHLVRLFFVKPVPGVEVLLQWKSQEIRSVTQDDGFFKFEWRCNERVQPGWHPVTVYSLDGQGHRIASGGGEVFVPFPTQYGFISDIDDTILVSHSATINKRLWVLFTRNPRTRKAFENVVDFYTSLAAAHTSVDLPNAFFYVSSSEWNLYDYLVEFFSYNKLPKGIFLLNGIKRWFELLHTGKTKHNGKLLRIVRILKLFPDLNFILLGDNSQKDPEIYETIVSNYPGKIKAVYIRNIRSENEIYTKELLAQMEEQGVATCMFANNREAQLHATSLGLIE